MPHSYEAYFAALGQLGRRSHDKFQMMIGKTTATRTSSRMDAYPRMEPPGQIIVECRSRAGQRTKLTLLSFVTLVRFWPLGRSRDWLECLHAIFKPPDSFGCRRLHRSDPGRPDPGRPACARPLPHPR